VVFSVRSDGHVLGAPGLARGGEGGTARLVRNAGTDRQEELSSKTASIVLVSGETIRLETPGGGGFGNPAERDPAALAADLRGGKISPGKAQHDYGDAIVARFTPP
jgi:N-methylhydantoinase B